MNKIYTTFFLQGEKFTVEDYETDNYAVYHEESFVGTCNEPTQESAMPVAIAYCKKRQQ